MNKLIDADPAVQNSVAIAAVVVGTVTIVTISAYLGRKWAAERLEGMKRASAITLNNLKR